MMFVAATAAAAPTALGGQVMATAALNDFTQIYAWLFFVGILFVVGGVLAYGLVHGVKPTHALMVGVVGGLLVFGAYLGAQAAPTVCTVGCAVTPAPTSASIAVTVTSANFVTGQTLTLSPLSVSIDLVYNTTSSAFCVTNVLQKCPAAAHNYAVLPLVLSRTDNINATYGFTTTINGIPTLTNSSTGLVFSPVGYTSATSTSPGIWKLQWSAGSIANTNPTQNAPSVTSGVGNLVGVPAFGSKAVALSVAFAGGNSTTGTFGWMATGYATYPMQIAFGGGGGATPAIVTVNFVFLGTHS